MKSKKAKKQICLNIPIEVYQTAQDQARSRAFRSDGLKLLPTSVIREWILAGARQVQQGSQEAYGQK